MVIKLLAPATITPLSIAPIIVADCQQIINIVSGPAIGRIIHNVFYEANKYSVHAEKDAIMQVKNKNRLNRCKMIVIKIVNGNISCAKPCEMCKKLLNKYKIKNVKTVDNDKIVSV
jgi:cytidine deaminase